MSLLTFLSIIISHMKKKLNKVKLKYKWWKLTWVECNLDWNHIRDLESQVRLQTKFHSTQFNNHFIRTILKS